MDILAAGPPVGGDGQLHLAAVEAADVLHAAFAVAALADDDGPLVVLQARRDDLAGAGAMAVDEDRHRVIEGDLLLRLLVMAGVRLLFADAGADGHDQAI